MRLDCEFIMTSRILFNDKSLSRTDIDLLSLIISLTLNSGYCYASNNFLARYINTSIRTISGSLSKLKDLKYIIIKYNNGSRRIYLNNKMIPIKTSSRVETFCSKDIDDFCYHNINNKYKIKKNSKLPDWMNNSYLCMESIAEKKEYEDICMRLNNYK